MGIYEELGVKTYINAWGKATALGASLINPKALEAMKEASTSFVDIEELHRRAGEKIAELTGAEYACVTCGASSALCAAIASCMTGKDEAKIMQLPDTSGMPDEVVVQKKHAGYYTMLARLTGAKIILAGDDKGCSIDQFKAAFSKKTCAVIYQANTVGEGVIPLEDVLSVSHERGVPVVVDAAAMTDHRKYVAAGADLVLYSGGKAFEGPTSSGFVCGRRDLVEACHLQRINITRPQKVGKEEIVGLLKALELYVNRDVQAQLAEEYRKVGYIADNLRGVSGIEIEVVHDSARPEIRRVLVKVDERKLGRSCDEIRKQLANGNPGIVLRPSLGNTLIIDVRQLRDGDELIVAERIRATLS
ncbi:MAG: aminotransferase class V-fold PLP-dependent enzyme [Candidatus Bathyarchaeia archaeon]